MGRSTVVLIAAGLAVFLCAACSETAKTEPPAQAEKDSGQAEEKAAGQPEKKVQEAEKKALDGKAVLQARCTKCHGLDKIEKHAKVDKEHWADTVSAMIKKGARLTDEERNVLIEYLANQ
jgi:cytochrome c5